jgi:hypothetical protein
MSRPVCKAAMPAEALQIAITTPMITAVSDPPAERWVAAVTASLNTLDAPGGRAWDRPLTSWFTVEVPIWIKLASPSSAIRAGNRARNQ